MAPPPLADIKNQIVTLLGASSGTISDTELSHLLGPTVTSKARVAAINALHREGRIHVTQSSAKVLLFELVREVKSDEQLVLECITAADTDGIWVKTIAEKTEIRPQKRLNKALKALVTRKIVAPFLTSRRQKWFILAQFRPDDSVTGGACFQGGVILHEVVQNVKSTCLQYFYDRYRRSYEAMFELVKPMETDNGEHEYDQEGNLQIYASAAKVFDHFKSAENQHFEKVKLIDVEHILNILVYECKLTSKDAGAKREYRYNPYNRDKTDLFYSPCMVCHLYADCKPGGVKISPAKCKYIALDKL